PVTAMPRRHLFILRSLQRRAQAARYAPLLRSAMLDADYGMARALTATARTRWSRRYLWRCLRGGHKIARSLATFAGWRWKRRANSERIKYRYYSRVRHFQGLRPVYFKISVKILLQLKKLAE